MKILTKKQQNELAELLMLNEAIVNKFYCESTNIERSDYSGKFFDNTLAIARICGTTKRFDELNHLYWNYMNAGKKPATSLED